jgi:hypothetical protein
MSRVRHKVDESNEAPTIQKAASEEPRLEQSAADLLERNVN